MSGSVAFRKLTLVEGLGARPDPAVTSYTSMAGRGGMRSIAIAGTVASVMLWGTSVALLVLDVPVAAMVFTVNTAVTVTVGDFFAWYRIKHSWVAGYEAGAAATYRAMTSRQGGRASVTRLHDAAGQ
jgi:hypothetical protein